MVDTDLVLIHGFWSAPATWDRLVRAMREERELSGLRIHAFGYESPKLRWPGSPARIPDYNDIAQSLPAYLAAHVPGTASIAIVTHSQGGLILQRYLAWMLAEGRGRELARIRLIVMLSCPNEGSEYLRSIRAVAGFSHHPQAGQLDVLNREVGEAHRVVMRQIVNAAVLDDRHCPIPVYAYSGRTDNIVLRRSAQSAFPNAEVLPGDHFTILDPGTAGCLTVQTLKRHILAISGAPSQPSQSNQPSQPSQRDATATPGGSGKRIQVGSIPARVEAFQRREALRLLAADPEQEDGVPLVQVLTGPKGAGKTQIAAAYARSRIRDGWPLVAWIAAETPDRLLVGMSELAREAGVHDPDGDSEESARRARRFLESYDKQALVVFDNAEDVDLLREYLPSTGCVQVVLTSYRHLFKHLGKSIDVNAFTEQESLTFLKERTGLDDPGGAAAVIAEAGGLPLALAQMASVIERQRLSYQTYLQRFRSMPIDQLPRSRGDPYPLAAPTAILLSIKAFEAEQADAIGRQTLVFLALLSSDGASRAFVHALGTSGSSAESPMPAVMQIDDAIAALVEASLGVFSFTREGAAAVSGEKIILHRLIARVVVERQQATGELAGQVLRAAEILTRYFFPEGSAWDDWSDADPLIVEAIEHVAALWANLSHPGWSPRPQVSEAVLRLRVAGAGYVGWSGDFRRAIRLGEAALGDCMDQLGPENLVTLCAKQHLAAAYRHQGQLKSAEQLLQQVLKAREHLLGTDHPDTLSALDNLALTYRNLGRLHEATALHRMVIASSSRVLGAEHPATLVSCHNLAYTYRVSGQLSDAIELYESTLASRRKVLGAEHRDTLDSQSCLASAYRQTGRIDDAIELDRRTIAAMNKVAGADHPRAITARNDLALAYRAAGRLAQAVELHKECADDFERVLGADHPLTLSCKNDLAFAYHSQGHYQAAVELREDLLPRYERELGPDQLDTLTCQHDLAWSYRMLGRVTDAADLHARTHAERRRILGSEHPATLSSHEHLGLSLLAAGRVSAALEALQQAWDDRREFLGAEHPQTLTSGNSLARAYRAAGRLEDARRLQEEILAARVRVLGEDHPRTLLARIDLCETLRQQGEAPRAAQAVEQVLADATRLLGDDHPFSLLAQHTLALCHASAQRWNDAILILERLAVVRARVLGPANPDTLTTRLALSCALTKAGRKGKAVSLARDVSDACATALDEAHPLVSMVAKHLAALSADSKEDCLDLFRAVAPAS